MRCFVSLLFALSITFICTNNALALSIYNPGGSLEYEYALSSDSGGVSDSLFILAGNVYLGQEGGDISIIGTSGPNQSIGLLEEIILEANLFVFSPDIDTSTLTVASTPQSIGELIREILAKFRALEEARNSATGPTTRYTNAEYLELKSPQPEYYSLIDDPSQGQNQDPAPVPEPSTWILLGTGLAGLAYYRRKKS